MSTTRPEEVVSLPRVGGQEDHFIVRLDYGVSPDDGTTGFYLDFNHLF
jgi:hypothetical protein